MLVELAADVARWPARAVEFRTLLEATQPVSHVRLDRGRTADLRDGDLLDNAGGPFDGLAHVAEMPRASSARRAGRYDIPDLGLFVWRLGCYSITQAPAFCWDQSGSQYSFSILGNDAPLLASPPDPGRLTEPAEVDVPAWIRRRGVRGQPVRLLRAASQLVHLAGSARRPPDPASPRSSRPT